MEINKLWTTQDWISEFKLNDLLIALENEIRDDDTDKHLCLDYIKNIRNWGDPEKLFEETCYLKERCKFLENQLANLNFLM